MEGYRPHRHVPGSSRAEGAAAFKKWDMECDKVMANGRLEVATIFPEGYRAACNWLNSMFSDLEYQGLKINHSQLADLVTKDDMDVPLIRELAAALFDEYSYLAVAFHIEIDSMIKLQVAIEFIEKDEFGKYGTPEAKQRAIELVKTDSTELNLVLGIHTPSVSSTATDGARYIIEGNQVR